MLELREGDFGAFFDVPFRIYGPDALYVSPLRSALARMLDPRANPLFARFGSGRFFTAHRNGSPVGRIVAHVHAASNALHGMRRAYFGFLDCMPDLEVARRLLAEAEAFGRTQGCDELAGNFNLTAMQSIGVMTEGDEHAPYVDQQYNPPYIPELLSACGFTPFFPMQTSEVDLRRLDPESLLPGRARERLEDPALRWEQMRASDFPAILEPIREVLNDGFADNPMFVPLTAEEMEFQAKDLALVLDPRITVLVHDAQGPVGTIVCIPDLNPLLRATRSRIGLTTPFHYLRYRLHRTRALTIFYSVARRMHNRGLNAAMLYRVTRALRGAGYETVGGTWIADSNLPSLRQLEKLGARRLHRLHLFGKPLRA